MSDMELPDLSKFVLPFGIIVIAWQFVKSIMPEKKDTPTSTAVTGACPRGAYYTRGLFGDCDPNYEARSLEGDFLSGGRCVCLGQPAQPGQPGQPGQAWQWPALPTFQWPSLPTWDKPFEPTPYENTVPFEYTPPPAIPLTDQGNLIWDPNPLPGAPF